MKILVIEDIEFKLKKILDLLDNLKKVKNISYDYAKSYATGLDKAIEIEFDLIILDMSLPTYEKTTKSTGGRIRMFGGKEIIRQLKRENKLKPFIILSQYKEFDNSDDIKSLNEVGISLKKSYGDYYISTILYESSSIIWKTLLEKEIIKYD